MIINALLKHNFTYAGAMMRVYHANKGEGLPKHAHSYTHATLCNAGSCEVRLPGRSYVINKNSTPLNLPAGEWHEIEALENNTVFVNIFSEIFSSEQPKYD
jgi:quercetin dioxygenase-like cupin family protein